MKKSFSLRFRFLVTVILAMATMAVFVGGLSIYEVDNYIQEQAKDFVNVTCTNESAQINDSLRNMEKSVNIMESYLMGFFEGEVDVTDRAFQERVIQNAEQMFIDVVTHTSTGGAVAYYFRLNPAISDSKAGLFYSKLSGRDEFVALEPTDLSLYDKNDIQHVGWFWQPYEAGEPIWMEPYHNLNNGILMISYVVPMYFDGNFIGVVGMDFDYGILAENVHSITVYEHGFAHLESDGVVLCNYEYDHDIHALANSDEYMHVSEELVNGMTFVLSASYEDIWALRYDISVKILLAVLILYVVFMVVAVLIVEKIVNPLKKLTEASVKLSNGDYDVELVQSNMQEIKLLSTAFENMAMHLREREELLRYSARRDSLTGLRNTTSYASWIAKFDEEIKNKQVDFGVAVLDINDLKKTNDQYGHGVGNDLIIAAAKLISDVFCDSPVFRIGGDEFLVVLQNGDLENCDALFRRFEETCNKTFINESIKIPIRIALGFARFDESRDVRFENVFQRADVAMYENKKMMKSRPDLNSEQ